MIIQSSTKKIAIVSVLIMLVTAAVVTWLWLVVGENAKVLQKQVALIENARATAALQEATRELAEATAEERTTLRSFVLHENDTISFLTRIESLAEWKGLEIITDSLQIERTEGLFDTLNLNLSIVGDKTQILQMIETLESLPYHSHITMMTVRYNKEKEQTEAQIQLLVSVIGV